VKAEAVTVWTGTCTSGEPPSGGAGATGVEPTGGVRGAKTTKPGFPNKSEAATPILTSEPLFGGVTVQVLVPTSAGLMFSYIPFVYSRAT